MALLTIADATKRYNNPIATGVGQTIVDNDPLMALAPWLPIAGDTQKVLWEKEMGGAGPIEVNQTIPDEYKNASSVDEKYFSLKGYVAQAEVDDLVQLTSVSAGVDPMVYELGSKAKNLGRQISMGLAGADARSGVIASYKANTAADLNVDGAGQDFGFGTLDQVANLLKGRVDFFSMDRSTHTRYKQLLRAQPGATEQVVIKDPYTGEERLVLAFEGIPVFLNDYLGVETAAGLSAGDAGYTAPTGTARRTSVVAGRWDDGSKKDGVAFIYPAAAPAGLIVKDVGVMETKVAYAKRIEQFLNFVNFSKYGLARVYNVK